MQRTILRYSQSLFNIVYWSCGHILLTVNVAFVYSVTHARGDVVIVPLR